MKESKHTPGPWLQRGVARPVWAQPLVDGEGYGIDQSLPANARLIAAAPKMLADLEWIAQEIRWGHDMTASLAIAEASIANAKGE
jgi:hypothetical protein